VEFRILGPLEAEAESGAVELGSAKQQTLLGVLLLHPNEVVSSERLIDELWGSHPPATAEKVVQTYVSQLRRSLGAETITTRRPGYVLHVEDDRLDADRFRRLAAAARRHAADGDVESAATLYRQALALWRGKPLAGLAFESFGRNEIDSLEEERLAALIDRIDCELALACHDELVPEIQLLVEQHPLRERVLAQLMLALYRSGRQTDALAAYRGTRDRLQEELGMEPGPSLNRLERQILLHDPALDLTPHTARATVALAPELTPLRPEIRYAKAMESTSPTRLSAKASTTSSASPALSPTSS
jgi:DNA-binding SARP family transcriptional activator